MTYIRKLFFLLPGAAMLAHGQANYSLCDLNKDGAVNIRDVQFEANAALGVVSPANDLAGNGVAGVADVQTEINVILYGCTFYSVTPRFAITKVSLVNQGWNPSDIPSAGNLEVRAANAAKATVVNEGWVAADIPSPGNLTVNAFYGKAATVVNQAWIPTDIPNPGNLAVNAFYGRAATVVNQAWISADIPSPGDVRFAAGLLVSVNNNTTSKSQSTSARVLGGGSSTAPVDLASVQDGDALIAGQTVRFRVYPPEAPAAGSDFLVNGSPVRTHMPFEVLITAPAEVSAFDLQAVIYSADGRVWRTPAKHLSILPDPGQTLTGRAQSADGNAAQTAVGTRTNGLTAEYFRADRGITSWSDLDRTPDKRGYVTAVNQPDSAVFGHDPFGTGFPGGYATRFAGEILVTVDGPHQFFLDAPSGARLAVDGSARIETRAGEFSPELQAAIDLTPGWHKLELDSFQNAFGTSLQLSWRQPNSVREVVRPESLAAETGALSAADATGSFRVISFPTILNTLDWHAVPADSKIRIVLNQSTSQERPIQ